MLLAELELTMVLTGNMSVDDLDRSALAAAPS
jgi:isopentenyl diphosphate isomerase/L-lactate dehydrogenase-like FMN-dependent dehydrogenase